MRVALADDFGRSRCCPGSDTLFTWSVGLDDDWPGGGRCSCPDDEPPGSEEPSGLPTLTIRERATRFLGPDGEPRYRWTDVVTDAPALMLEERIETNDATGQTKVTARAAVAWAGGTAPKETSVAHDSRGYRWEVVSCVPLPDRLQLRLERIDQSG